MDRLSKLRDLIDQAVEELSRPTALTHEQYAVVATLHEIALEISTLRLERLQLETRLQRYRP